EKAARETQAIPSTPRVPSMPPDTARGEPRAEMPTFTDEVELEKARVKSTFTVPPPSSAGVAAYVPPSPTLPPAARVLPVSVAPPLPREEPPDEEPPTAEGLLASYEKRFGSFDRVPVVVLAQEDVTALAMDGRASMLLALLDGRSSVQAILDIGILNPLDTLSGLAELLDRGVIILLG
ncbi:MAG: hypothetical protein ACRELB_04015, partial [Polyangiaceae bacterium]